MTNKEARSVLIKTRAMCISGKVTEWEKAQRLAYKALRENEELKTELEKYHNIEELSGYDIGEVVNGLSGEILRLKDEIEELKAELEQSIKSPCKVGDNVFEVLRNKITKQKVVGISIGNVFEDYEDFGDAIVLHTQERIFEGKSSVYDIGKTVFLTREEAEEKLKRR